MFGPLFYTTVTAAVLLTACVQLVSFKPMFTVWLQERSLVRSLQSNDSREREAAVLALMRNGSTRIVPLLLEAAHDSRSERRVLACRYLIIACTKPEDVVAILVAAASDADPSVRFEAASSFGRVVDGGVFGGVSQFVSTPLTTTAVDLRAASIAALRRLLQDQESKTRVAAAEALGHFGRDAGSAADLAAATGDEERDVRLAAAQALLRINGSSDPAAGRTLMSLVADPEPIADRRAVLDVVLSASTEVQDQAAVALGARLNADDISINADVMDCLAAMGTGAPAYRRSSGNSTTRIPFGAGAAVALASIDRRSTARVSGSPAQDRCRSLRARRMATNRPGKNYRGRRDQGGDGHADPHSAACLQDRGCARKRDRHAPRDRFRTARRAA